MPPQLSEDIVEAMINEVDEDNSDALDFDEFKKLVFTLIANTTATASKFSQSSY